MAVTGGAGRLGRTVVAGLQEAGHEVLSLDRVAHEDAPSVVVDLTDAEATSAALGDFGPDAVVHLAAIAVPFSAPEPTILRTNTMLAYTVVAAAVEAGAREVVVASSPTVHGYGAPTGWTPPYLPLDEESPTRPWNAYSLSKLTAEQVVRMFVAQVGERVRFATFRPCFVIAPEEWRGALTQQGHTVAARLADPALSAPALFNYLDARDAASFVAALLRALPDIPNGETFLVGADDALATEPLADLLPRFHPGTSTAARSLTGTTPAFSNAKAKRLLDWRPRFSWRTELVGEDGVGSTRSSGRRRPGRAGRLRRGAPMTGPARIAEVRTRLHRGTLLRPWGADVTVNHVIEVEVVDTTGARGVGFSWTPSIGAHAVQALLDHDIRDAVLGWSVDPAVVWPTLWVHLHEAGSGGVTTIAMAGLDLALWDLAGRRAERSLAGLLGRRRERAEVYGSGVNLHYTFEELVAQAQRWVAAGHRSVKIKVGGPDLGADRERVAAVREVLGPDRDLMIDANQRWDLERATAAMTALEPYHPRWIEEPLRADDLPGHAELRKRIATPVAMGENLHTVYRFRDALDVGACDVVQPNVVRVGGVTPFLQIAALADERGVELHPHLLPEVSGQLALTLERPCLVEDVEDASLTGLGLLDGPSPVTIRDGYLTETGAPGLGLRFQPALAGAVGR